MKYFNFTCEMKPKSTLRDNTLIDCINEVNKYCSYLSRMYEYYFSPTKTGNVTAISVHLVEHLQRLDAPSLCINMRTVANIIDLSNFKQMQPEEKSLYIIDLCQKSMLSLVREMKWNTEPFEYTYDKIIRGKGYFREYWRGAKSSPDRERKAQIYFEDDFEKNGIYVDFTDKKGKSIHRIGFAWIDYSEEKSLGKLYEQKIPFVVTLFNRYYEDYTFCEGELEQAQRDLLKLMNLESWQPWSEEKEKQFQVIYKLVAVDQVFSYSDDGEEHGFEAEVIFTRCDIE